MLYCIMIHVASCTFVVYQNFVSDVKTMKFKDLLEATTISTSSLLVWVHSYRLGSSKGIQFYIK